MKFLKELYKNRVWLLMVLPGTLWFLLFAYLPMAGNVIAFKKFRIDPDGFFASIMNSEWVGWDNFKYLFSTDNAWIITRNTIGYNFIFIVVGLVTAVTTAIVLSELANKRLAKVYQTGMLFPHFLSWVIVSYFVFTFLSPDRGLLNNILGWFGVDSVAWYSEPQYWPYIIVIMSIWKGVGYGSIVYLASIAGIDKTYYEAAMIDGATKFQQVKKITLPMLKPLIIILLIMDVGKIFNSDFGLFFQVPRDSGALYDVTNTIDTFVYRGLISLGDIGMSTAAGLYQSTVGFILVIITNYVVRKLDEESALF